LKLIQIVKELNVGLSTLVEHLVKKGYEVENKPTAKITDQMYAELLREFQKSGDIKQQAKSLNFSSGKSANEEGKSVSEPAKASDAAIAESKQEPAITLQRPTVLGKIDLSSRLQQRNKDKSDGVVSQPPLGDTPRPVARGAASQEVPVAVTPPTPGKVAPSSPQPSVVTSKEAQSAKESVTSVPRLPEEQELLRAETPELRGLKILGKIDTGSLNQDRTGKSKQSSGTAANGNPQPPPSGNAQSEDAKNKRKRKRKKVGGESAGNSSPSGTGAQQGRDHAGSSTGAPRRQAARPGASQAGPGRDAPREVSTKEIEEKIKATMARLSGGGKNKRQKLQRDKRERFREKADQISQESQSGKLELTEFISAQELANLLDVPIAEVITVCMNLGVIVSINQRLDAEIIELVAAEFDREVEFISVEEQAEEDVVILEDDPESLLPRAPIVTVMGHVDHGKTSFLDYIRSANVVSSEAGGITQHIGAYEIVTAGNKKVTFLDTPGHEAFTAMRARGAKVTDVAIIIIAADDNIMPQTREAISHAQAAGVPIIFAINKVDKAGAQPEKIKQELASMNFLVEEWGGKYQSQDISAKTGQGIPEILEKVLLEAEMLDLKANPSRAAVGTVVEASLDKGRGYVTKLLVQNGSLSDKDCLVAGEFAGRVKALLNERGQRIKVAGPSTPVLVLGLSGAPQAGDRFKVVDSDQEARQIASKRAQIIREQTTRAMKRISLDEIGRRLALGNFKELKLIVKGDVDGSIEALSDSLIKLSIDKVQVNVIHKAVGGIIESDVLLASASDAIIIGFQVRPSAGARKLAEREGVEIKTYSIIYEAIDEVKAAIEGMLEPTKVENIIGMVEIREIYRISKVGTIAGCYVQEGKVTRNSHIRIVRDGIVIFPTRENSHGEISSLKRFKEDVREVRNGMECGLSVKNFNEMKVGDLIEVYEISEVKQKLE